MDPISDSVSCNETIENDKSNITNDDIVPEPVNNVYHSVRCTFINNTDKSFVKTLRDESYRICREKISMNYIKHAFRKFTGGFLYNDTFGRRLGFCIWKIYNTHNKLSNAISYTMHVLLICSRTTDIKLSRNMFYDLDNYCIENRISCIELEAIHPDLEKYYATFGFETERYNDGIWKMRKITYVKQLYNKPLKNKNTSKRYTRKIRTTGR